MFILALMGVVPHLGTLGRPPLEMVVHPLLWLRLWLPLAYPLAVVVLPVLPPLAVQACPGKL